MLKKLRVTQELLNIIHVVIDYKHFICSQNYVIPKDGFNWLDETERYYNKLPLPDGLKHNRDHFVTILSYEDTDELKSLDNTAFSELSERESWFWCEEGKPGLESVPDIFTERGSDCGGCQGGLNHEKLTAADSKQHGVKKIKRIPPNSNSPLHTEKVLQLLNSGKIKFECVGSDYSYDCVHLESIFFQEQSCTLYIAKRGWEGIETVLAERIRELMDTGKLHWTDEVLAQ